MYRILAALVVGVGAAIAYTVHRLRKRDAVIVGEFERMEE